MEENGVCESSSLPICQPEPWTSADPQLLNGQEEEEKEKEEKEEKEEEVDVWGRMEVQIEQTHEMELNPPPKGGLQSCEEAEQQWEHMLWPVYPMTRTAAPLSCATVQWDMAEPSSEALRPLMDGGSSNEPDSGRATSLEATPLSLHPSEDADTEFFSQEDAEEQDVLDLLLPLDSNPVWVQISSQTRDSVDVQQQASLEKDDWRQEPSDRNNEVLLRTDSEDEEEQLVSQESVETVEEEEQLVSGNSVEYVEEEEQLVLEDNADSEDEEEQLVSPDGVETVEEEEQSVSEDAVKIVEEEELLVWEDAIRKLDSCHNPEEREEDSEDRADKQQSLEEEEETPSIVLTGLADSEEELHVDATNGTDSEEENAEKVELPEVQTVTNVSCNEEDEDTKPTGFSCDVEFPQQPLQRGSTGLTTNLHELIHLLQSEEERLSASDTESEEDTELLQLFNDHPACQTEEPAMSKDVDQNVDPEATQQPEDSQEQKVEEAGNAERTDEEIDEETGHLEQAECLEQQSEWITDCEQPSQDQGPLTQPQSSESEPLEVTELCEQIQQAQQVEVKLSEDQSDLLQHLEQPPQLEPAKGSEQPEDPATSEQTVHVEAEGPGSAERSQQMEPSEQTSPSPEAPALSAQTDEVEKGTEQLFPVSEVSQPATESESAREERQAEVSQQTGGPWCVREGSLQTLISNGGQPDPAEPSEPIMNGSGVDREMARRLAERLHTLDGIQRADVVKHLDKDNDFSRAVGEEYLKFFDFTGQTLDHALRALLKVVILIGETQERERVLQHFSGRFHECNPDSFSSAGAVLTLTCALMLLNTDLHGQNVGKAMSSSKFVSNLDGMNEGENFSKDLLKSFYNAIKSEALEWAVNEEELKSSVLLDDDTKKDAPLRCKSNPFQDVPHDKKAIVVKQGFLQRKVHADIDGKRTPWGKRSWKTFYGVLRGMVLYLQKDDRGEPQSNEEVVSVHHSLAEPAADYTKRPHVFRLQTADWRVFLFQASSKVEMNLWISRMNLVSALQSSPPFPAAVGSQRRFCRPILPASQSAHTLERQLQSHSGMLESFEADLLYLQQNLPDGRKAKAKELEEHRVRAEYLHHEICRYEVYIQVLEAWQSVKQTGEAVLSAAGLNLFDKAMHTEEGPGEEDGGLKRSHSSPSLELDMATTTVIKVRRNISERRTYRRTIIPRRNKDV
ncbi:uncharacterized protein LOC143011123 [Genypterus blacodes]|uniref:uncharacterized protein LOC143011123 n=1 Tax=Genypterus blacodes TaxID=154954 RepID=UPI003F7740A9